MCLLCCLLKYLVQCRFLIGFTNVTSTTCLTGGREKGQREEKEREGGRERERERERERNVSVGIYRCDNLKSLPPRRMTRE